MIPATSITYKVLTLTSASVSNMLSMVTPPIVIVSAPIIVLINPAIHKKNPTIQHI